MKNVLFIMNVYDESVEMVSNNVERVRLFYPESKLVLIYDGTTPYGISGASEVFGSRIKVAGKSGLFTKRYLEFFLNYTSFEYCIKIDPDTEIVQRMTDPLPDPNLEVMFCRYSEDGMPHGGAVGFTRPLARKLTSSGWLEEPFLCLTEVAQQDPIFKRIIQFQRIKCLHRPDFGYTETPLLTDAFRHSRINSRTKKR